MSVHDHFHWLVCLCFIQPTPLKLHDSSGPPTYESAYTHTVLATSSILLELVEVSVFSDKCTHRPKLLFILPSEILLSPKDKAVHEKETSLKTLLAGRGQAQVW